MATSTHDLELADLLSDTYLVFHFCEEINHQSLCFDYLMKLGKLKTRNAIRILELSGYPKAIVADARATLDQLVE